jgi:propane monooxygenase small subunit
LRVAAAQNDFITPAVVSAAEGDYERNLANTVKLCHLLATDPQYGAANTVLFGEWLVKHAALAKEATSNLQPVWSLPRVKVVQYTDALEQAHNRLRAIGAAVGFDVRPAIER